MSEFVHRSLYPASLRKARFLPRARSATSGENIYEYCFTSLSAQSWQYRDRRKPGAGTMPYSYFEWLQGFFIVHSAIGSTVHSRPLNSLTSGEALRSEDVCTLQTRYISTMIHNHNVKIVLALRISTGRAFHKAGPDIKEALDPVLVFIRGTTNLFESVESSVDISSISAEQVSQPDMQVGFLLGFGK